MMNHIVRNRQHISNPLGMGSHGMDFRIRIARSQLHRMSLKCHMGNAMHCIALAAVDTILHVMVHLNAGRTKTKQHIFNDLFERTNGENKLALHSAWGLRRPFPVAAHSVEVDVDIGLHSLVRNRNYSYCLCNHCIQM